MFTQAEIEEIKTIIDGIIEHIESYYECEEIGPSMSYQQDNNTFDIDYTCWGKDESLSSISTIYTLIDSMGKKNYVFNVVESGYSQINGDFESEETIMFSSIDELTKKLFEQFGF